MPTYTISPPEAESPEEEETSTTEEGDDQSEASKRDSIRRTISFDRLHSVSTLSSVLEDPRFAILPEGSTLDGWTKADVAELNDHVRHMLHSRRSKFKRAMKGFGKYVSKREYQQPRTSIASTTDTGQQLDSSSLYTQPSSLYSDSPGSFS